MIIVMVTIWWWQLWWQVYHGWYTHGDTHGVTHGDDNCNDGNMNMMKTIMMTNGIPWVEQAHQRANREGRTGRWTKKTVVMTMINVMTWHKKRITKVSCDQPEEATLLQRQKMLQVLSVKLAQQHLLLCNKWSRLKQKLEQTNRKSFLPQNH